MGLDMYLKVNSKHVAEDALRAMKTSDGMREFYRTRGTAMYWRKANAIHRWFVDNVQYGEDDCKVYEVTAIQLVELRDLCRKVVASSKLVQSDYFEGKFIEDSSVAEKLLPTTEGFFFGSTRYDEWYLADLEYTANAIQLMLEHTKGDGWEVYHEKEPDWMVRFYYTSSW